MANKKCPKCGEDNPAEAVMCWACYTPLGGGGGAVTAGARAGVAGAAGVPGAAGAATLVVEEEKKKVDPKVFALGGLAVVGILVALFVNGAFSGGGGTAPIAFSEARGIDPGRGSGGVPVVQPATVVSGSGNPTGPSTPPVESKAPYDVAVSPNPQFATGVIGIVPLQSNVTPAQAQGFAQVARNQYAASGPWKKLQIYVFSNKETGRSFATYQNKRRGERLDAGNFSELAASGLWSNTPACLMTDGGKSRPYSPSQNPSSWWGRG